MTNVQKNAKSAFFNRKLYLDSLKQLKITGIIFSVISLLISFAVPLLVYLSMQNPYSNIELVPATLLVPALYLIMLVGGIVMPITAFSFLTKRNASDFYHSLPNTRVSTYLSIAAGVLTWLTSIILANVLVSGIAYSVFKQPFNPLQLVGVLFTFLTGTFLVTACTLIGVSITGTIISNLSATLVLLFLPRFLSMMCGFVLLAPSQFLSFSSLGILFDYQYNLPFSLTIGGIVKVFFSYHDATYTNNFTNLPAMLYTLLLAALYLTLGCFLFARRKSEYAEKSAPNRSLQHVYRCGITFPFLMVVGALFGISRDKWNFFSNDYSVIILFTIFALMVYCVYELITTKKWRSLLRSMPLFFVLFAVSIGLGAGVGAFQGIVHQKHLPATEIANASIIPRYPYYPNDNDYTRLNVDQARYQDPAITQLLSKVWKDNIGASLPGQPGIGPSSPVTCIFRPKFGLPVTRYLEFPTGDYNRLTALMEKEHGTQTLLRKLPQKSEIKRISINNLTALQMSEVWDVYRQEVSALSDQDYRNAVNADKNITIAEEYGVPTEEIYRYGHLNVIGCSGASNFSVSYPLTRFTPKATNLYLKYASNGDLLKQKLEATYSSYQKSPVDINNYFTMDLYLIQNDHLSNLHSENWESNDKEDLAVMQEKFLHFLPKEQGIALMKYFLEHLDFEPAQVNQPHITVNLQGMEADRLSTPQIPSYQQQLVAIDPETLDYLTALLKSLEPPKK